MKPAFTSRSLKRWLPCLQLLAVLYLMYSSTFLSDYLMKDEWNRIGQTKKTIPLMSRYFFAYGRGLFGLYHKTVYGFVGYDPDRVRLIRFINFAFLAVLAVILLAFLKKESKKPYMAFLTVLFFISQLPYEGLMGYSLQLISNTLPSIALSMLAFYFTFYLFRQRKVGTFLKVCVTFLILFMAMQSTQLYAFFCTIPISYLALSEWEERKSDIIQFLFIAFFVLIFSTTLYKISLDWYHGMGGHGYELAERGIAELLHQPGKVVLTAVNPLAYWSAFKFWTFPYPLTSVPPISMLLQARVAVIFMTIWLALIGSCVFIEIRTGKETRTNIVSKWLTVGACVALAAFFVVADSPIAITDHRPHIFLTFSGLICFTSAYALRTLALRFGFLRSAPISALAGLLVFIVAFGAQSNVRRNMVDNHSRQIDFIRSSLKLTNRNYGSVIVVLPKDYPLPNCASEPCGPWMGDIIEDSFHLTQPAAYRYALATIGVDAAGKDIRFVGKLEKPDTPGAAIIDWNIYLRAQRNGDP